MRKPPVRNAAALVAAGILAFAPAAAGAPGRLEAHRSAAASISAARCKGHVDFLASDLLEGRATPSRGLDVAATYVSTQLGRAGLEPGGDEGAWLQRFDMLRETRLESSALAIDGAELKPGEDFVALPLTGNGRAEGGLVFAGYGIVAPDEQYDDYAGLDVKGKVVLVLRHEPHEKGGSSAFGGARHSRHAYFTTKIRRAAERGAAALLLVTDPLNHEDTTPEAEWPARGEAGEGADIPVLHVTVETARRLLGGRDLKALQKEIDDGMAPRSFAVPGRAVAVSVKTTPVYDRAANVVGILRGSDPALSGEAVVIGAHYDHVGVQGEDGPAFYGQIGRPVNGDRIHNGADDNASGTAALLEVARAFAEAGVAPRRTVIFIAFAGEELGLLGSQHYAEHPVIPNAKTVAMINLDMVGRNDPSRVSLGGVPSAALARALERANATVGMQTTRLVERGGYDSDHGSFQAKGVPTVFFFAGDHPDYHRVTDHADKIEAEKVARIARFALLTAVEIAEDESAGPGWF